MPGCYQHWRTVPMPNWLVAPPLVGSNHARTPGLADCFLSMKGGSSAFLAPFGIAVAYGPIRRHNQDKRRASSATQCRTIDLNPIIVGAPGEGIIAVDIAAVALQPDATIKTRHATS
jgi:hypothetical protein